MPLDTIPPADDLTAHERRNYVAAILARGVIRYCRRGKRSPSRDSGLEVVSQPRLTVSRRLARNVGDEDDGNDVNRS